MDTHAQHRKPLCIYTVEFLRFPLGHLRLHRPLGPGQSGDPILALLSTVYMVLWQIWWRPAWDGPRTG